MQRLPAKAARATQDPPEPIFHACYFCQQPIWTDNWVADDFTAHKPAPRECWEAQQVGSKQDKVALDS